MAPAPQRRVPGHTTPGVLRRQWAHACEPISRLRAERLQRLHAPVHVRAAEGSPALYLAVLAFRSISMQHRTTIGPSRNHMCSQVPSASRKSHARIEIREQFRCARAPARAILPAV